MAFQLKKTPYYNYLSKWLIVFFAALLFRGILFFEVMQHSNTALQPDSRMYLGLAEGLRQHGTMGYVERAGAPDMERMPGYPAFLAVVFALTGGGVLVVLAIQIILDSMSCVMVGVLGERVWERLGLWSGLLAAINLNMMTYAHFILNDSIFLLLFLLSILSVDRFMNEPGWKRGLTVGGLLGLATLVRPVLFYFPMFLLPFLWIYLAFHRRAGFIRSAGKALVVGLAFSCLVGPWLVRNHVHGGRFRLTAQAGEHLAQYVVPFVWQYSKGIPFIEGMKTMNRNMKEAAEKKEVTWKDLSQFERSDLQVRMALRILKEEPPVAILKAWVFGMIKNLFAPAVVDASYLLGVERPHFFYTEGKTLLERGWNFVRGIQGWFGGLLVACLIVMPLVRFAQVWGWVSLFKKGSKPWTALLFLLVIGYFLLVSGPVGYAKYRLPFEPVLIVLLAVGLKEIATRFPITRLRRSASARIEG